MRRLVLLSVLLIGGPGFAQVPDGVSPNFLVVSVNGESIDGFVTAWKQGGSWAMEPKDWIKIGYKISKEEAAKAFLTDAELGGGLTVDEASQTASATIPAARAPNQSLGNKQALGELSAPAPGVLINYDLAAQQDKNGLRVSGGHAARIAGNWGQLTTTGQLNSNKRGTEYKRGMTTWQKDDYKRQITYQAGDVQVDGANLGGVRVTKDPTLDPFTPTFPIPFLGGVAQDAGTLELLVNKQKVSATDVSAGPLTLERYPLKTGRSATDLVLTDKYGREQVIQSSDVYLAPTMLRPGLATWSLGMGFVRQGSTNSYGPFAIDAGWAKGVTNNLTIRATTQAGDGNANAAVGAQVLVGAAGVVTAEVGKSNDGGKLYEVGYSYTGQNWNLSASTQKKTDYWELSKLNSTGAQTQKKNSVSVGWSSPDRAWRTRLGYNDLTSTYASGEQRIRYLDFGIGLQKGKQAVGAQVTYDLEQKAPTVQLSYRYQFKGGQGYAQARQAPGQDAKIVVGAAGTTTIADQRIYTNVEASHAGNENTLRIQADTRTHVGSGRVDVYKTNQGVTTSAQWSGGLYIGEGGFTATEAVSGGGYAVVNIGVPDVPVRASGRDLGKTNKRGQLVITSIPALMPTKISLDQRAIPNGTQLDSAEVTVIPRRDAGARADFPKRTDNARSFTVPGIEPGSPAKTTAESTQVGYEGMLFLEHPEAGMPVEIQQGDLKCVATLPKELPAFGESPELKCMATQK